MIRNLLVSLIGRNDADIDPAPGNYWDNPNPDCWVVEADNSITLAYSLPGYAGDFLEITIDLVNPGDYIEFIHVASPYLFNSIDAYDGSGNLVNFAANGNFNEGPLGYSYGTPAVDGAPRRLTRTSDDRIEYSVDGNPPTTTNTVFSGAIQIRINQADTFPWSIGLNIQNPTTNI